MTELVYGTLFPSIRHKLEERNFILQEINQGDVIWGFDGVTKYFPEDNYIRENVNGSPKFSLKLRKTSTGITLIINSVPFQTKHHLDKAPLKEEDVISIVDKYLKDN
ncbi:MAG: hypothetical protein J4428_01760 [Candidatus Aenigmarchaeota archaeon]|nr:hypothetical protein [Candidatus Aenigmarchaeota archaeon]